MREIFLLLVLNSLGYESPEDLDSSDVYTALNVYLDEQCNGDSVALLELFIANTTIEEFSKIKEFYNNMGK